jgi:uncharacterized protein involved in propanediol utilization
MDVLSQKRESELIGKRARIGHGRAIAHNGELMQGLFQGPDGRMHRGLVTLPNPRFFTQAKFLPSRDSDLVSVSPSGKHKAARAARVTLDHLGVTGWGGTLTLNSSFPADSMRWGLGTSTADVTATIVAVARSWGSSLSTTTQARLAVQAEQASDSIAFGRRCVLFAQREGTVLEEFGRIPPLTALGFNTNAQGVDTLAMPQAQYDWQEVEGFRVLRGAIRRAIRSGDLRLLGRVATASAHINQRYLPICQFSRLLALADEVGALGLAVSHSGTVAALLFDPAADRKREQLSRARRIVTELGCEPQWTFDPSRRGTLSEETTR